MENEELFLIKKLKKENLKEKNNENIKIEYIEKRFKIPKANKIQNLLIKYHDNHLHQGRDGTYY